MEDKKEEVLEATIQAGRELVNSRRVSNETLNRIQQPIIDYHRFAQIDNIYCKTCNAEGMTPKEFKDKNRASRPDSIESFMLFFPFGLNFETAGEGKTISQFYFSGEVAESCYIAIKRGKVDADKD
jgi:hypothetical protein